MLDYALRSAAVPSLHDTAPYDTFATRRFTRRDVAIAVRRIDIHNNTVASSCVRIALKPSTPLLRPLAQMHLQPAALLQQAADAREDRGSNRALPRRSGPCRCFSIGPNLS